MFIRVLFSILLLLPLHAHSYYRSWSKPRPISIDLQYHTYSDLLNDNSNAKVDLSETYTAALNLRFYRIFSAIIAATKATDSSLNGYGLGLRVDLPGFLFIGSASNDLVRARKRHSFNTYLQWVKFAIKEAPLDTYVADRIGFGVDSFLTDQLYLNLELMTYSHQGNQFVAMGAGLGFEF